MILALALVPGILIALTGILTVCWLVWMVRMHGAGPVAWRWHSGNSLDGHARANSTWLHRSSDTLHYTGHAIWWHHLPRLVRAGIRCGTELALVLILAGLVLDPGVAVPLYLALLGAGAAYGAYRGIRFSRDFWFYFRWVWPLRRNLELNHGVPPKSLKVSRDRSKVALALPPGWRGTQRERDLLTSIITSKLGMFDLDADDPGQADWQEHHRRPHVKFALAAPPPSYVELADARVLAQVRELERGTVMAGYGRRGVEMPRKLRTETPMAAVSMPTNTGKSVTSGLAAATLASQGYIPAIADCKMTSHRWAKGLPNVAYASRIAHIHALLLWLEKDVKRRYDLVDEYADIDGRMPPGVFIGDPIAFLIEELNTLQKWLARYWRELRAASPNPRGLPARSPAQDALDTLLCISRAAEYVGILIAQRLSAAATSGAGGNADARENICLKWMWDPGMGTWRMLGNDCPLPKARNHPGRYQLVDPAEVHEVQGIFATNRELRALALSGTVAEPPPDMPFVARDGGYGRDGDGWTWRAEPLLELAAAGGPRTGPRGPRTGPDLGGVLGQDDLVVDAEIVGEEVGAGAYDEWITIEESVDLGIAKVGLAAARRRPSRDPRHPKGKTVPGQKAKVYNAIDLADYWAEAA